MLSSQHGTVEARNLWEWCWVPGGASPGLGCRCWGRSRGIAEIAHFVRSLVGSKYGAVETGGREAVQYPRMVEMPLQILSPNREALDLLGKSTNFCGCWLGFPSITPPFLSQPACQGGQKARGSRPSCPKASQICSRLSQMGSVHGAWQLWVDRLAATLRASPPSLAEMELNFTSAVHLILSLSSESQAGLER